MEEELDPEIAALISGTVNENSTEDSVDITVDEIDIPTNHKSLFTKSIDEVVHGGRNKSIHDVDLSKKEFAKIENPLNDTPSQVFNDTKYYKTALTGENASAQTITVR